MKIQQLKYFIEVCNSGTITEAASKLFVSQPSITTAIKELEQDLGANLFRRVNKKLHITPEGEYLLAKAIVIVNEIEVLKSEIGQMTGSNKKIKLGLPVQAGVYLMPIILGEFSAKYPDTIFEIIELGSYDLRELVEKEEIDLAIMAEGEINSNIFDTRRLFSSELCFVCGNNHHLATRSSVTLEEISEEKFVLLSKNYLVTKIITDSFKVNKISPNIIMITKHLNTVKNLVSHNIASSFMLKEGAAYDENCVTISLEPKISVPVSVFTKKDRIKTDRVKQLIQFLTKEVKYHHPL